MQMTLVRVNNVLEMLTYPDDTGMAIVNEPRLAHIYYFMCRRCAQHRMRMLEFGGAWSFIYPFLLTEHSIGRECEICTQPLAIFVNTC